MHVGCFCWLLQPKCSPVRYSCAFRMHRLAQIWCRRDVSSQGLVLLTSCRHLGQFFICVAGVAFSARCSIVDRPGSKWEAVLEVIFRSRRSTWWTWTTFFEGSKSRFLKLSSFLFLGMMMIRCGRWSTSGASGSFSGIDLDKKMAETVEHRFWHVPCSCVKVPAMFFENLRCARATLSSLWLLSLWRGPAQPFQHFGHAWRGAPFDSQGNLPQRSWQGGLF